MKWKPSRCRFPPRKRRKNRRSILRWAKRLRSTTDRFISEICTLMASTPADEVEAIKVQISASEETEKPKVNFAVGETIKINNGPFQIGNLHLDGLHAGG